MDMSNKRKKKGLKRFLKFQMCSIFPSFCKGTEITTNSNLKLEYYQFKYDLTVYFPEHLNIKYIINHIIFICISWHLTGFSEAPVLYMCSS
jgi:hypothetical protein